MAVKDKWKSTKGKPTPGKTYTLDDYEFNYVRDLNGALQFHILRQRLVAGFLTYLARERMGIKEIPEGNNLEFELELQPESDKKLTVRVVSSKEE